MSMWTTAALIWARPIRVLGATGWTWGPGAGYLGW